MINVLVVDDIENNRLALELLLESFDGLNIKEAEDGVEAVECFEKEYFDLVFMDIMMPNMDGIEASKIIKSRHPKTMIIAISALDDEKSRHSMLLAGAEDYLTKPIESKLFTQRIKNYISIIKYRENISKNRYYPNPFSKEILSKKVVFNIEKEETLAEFWNETLGEGVLAGHSDAVRFIYGLGLWLLKTKHFFQITLEEDEEAFFLGLVECGSIKRLILKRLLKKHLKETLYIFDDESLFLRLQKFRESESIHIDEETKKILGKTHQGSLNAKDYVEGSVISLLPKIESLEAIEDAIDIDILKLENSGLDGVIDNLAVNFNEYYEVLELLTNFNHLAFAVKSLVEFLEGLKSVDTNEEKISQLATMLLHLLQDLTSWRKHIFIKQDAVNIHYLDASLLSSCMQIRALFDDKAIDEGDELEFF